MTHAGAFVLQLAFATSVAGAAAGLFGIATRRYRLATVARNALYAVCFLALLATLFLLSALVGDDFSLRYVASNSSRETPVYYKLTALWGGHAGSLLFWLTIQAVYGAAVAFFHRRTREGMLLPGVHVTILVLEAFFLFVLAFIPNSQPFELLASPEPNGRGLNAILQDPVMAIHPPNLYLGFVGLSIPFAFAMGALLTGTLGAAWVRLSRWWTILAWSFLTWGIVLGGFWAYRELGWGGYWAWDAVENASFLPWLAATAFLHSVIVTEKYGMLKLWSTALIFVAFALTIFGTFLTRSGFLTSVHTFALDEELGWAFVKFLGAAFAIWLGLVVWRWRRLASENQIQSFLSREFMFLANNLVLVALTAVILFFTLWPNITERIVTLAPEFAARFEIRKSTITTTTFNAWTAPLFVALVGLTGLGTVTSWKKTSEARLLRALAVPGALAAVTAGLLLVVLPGMKGGSLEASDFKATAVLALVVLVGALTVGEFVRGVRARRKSQGEGFFAALAGLYTKNHRRYGGYVVHLGTLFIMLGVTSHQAYQIERIETLTTLEQGRPLEIAGFRIRFDEWKKFERGEFEEVANAEVWQATLTVFDEDGDRELGRVNTQKRFYDTNPEQPVTEVGVLKTHGGTSDLYIVLAGLPSGTRAPFQVFFNPMVNAIWAGAALMITSSFLLLVPWPDIYRRARTRSARRADRREIELEAAVSARKKGVG